MLALALWALQIFSLSGGLLHHQGPATLWAAMLNRCVIQQVLTGRIAITGKKGFAKTVGSLLQLSFAASRTADGRLRLLIHLFDMVALRKMGTADE